MSVERHLSQEELEKIKRVVDKARTQKRAEETSKPSKEKGSTMRACQECGQEFSPTHGNQKRCPTCRDGKTDPKTKADTNAKAVEKAEVNMPEAIKETYPPLEFEGYKVSYDEPVPAPMAHPGRSVWLPFLLEFVASSAETVCLAVGDSKKADSIREVLKNQIEKQGLVDRVRAKKRKTSVYLVKRSSEYWEG